MVKQGYKQTEIGVIPQDWNVHTLEMLYNITSSKRVFQSQWRKSGIPFYRAREIAVMSEGKSAPEDLYIDADLYNQYTRQYGSIKKDDVLITGVGTLGKVYVVKESDKFYFKDGNIIWLQFKDGFSSQYLKHQYDMPVLINQVFGNAGGSTVATYTITNAKSTKVPVPPLDEQKRIAEALSDVDGMISSLEKLIAKKKAIKQGAMQELLTGKKRLPGFAGEWHHEPFGKLCTICRGGSPRPIQDYLTTSDSGINWIKIGDVKPNAKYITSTQEKIVESGVLMSRRVYKGDFILSNSMSFGRPYILKLDGCIHDGWLAIQDYQVAFDTDFLYYVLGSNYVFEQYIQMAAGSSVQNLNKEKVAQLKLYIPALEEQTAIASILSDMDNEIEALEQKLAKTRQIKQGMMQQLLTGKIRLV